MNRIQKIENFQYLNFLNRGTGVYFSANVPESKFFGISSTNSI